jgi:branched-subunit amino acid ABC-type transport system permease component
MKKWLIANSYWILGSLTGGVAGFLYWKYVGCLTGTCAMTSNPLRSTFYFAIMGALVFSLFKNSKKEKSI